MTCEETYGILPGRDGSAYEDYMRCGKPAVMQVKHRGRDEGPYWMCLACGTHNVQNRNAEDVTPEAVRNIQQAQGGVRPTRSSLAGRGKYSKVIDTLPRLLGENPDYQTRVNAVKDTIRENWEGAILASGLAHRYAAIRAEKEVIEAELSECNLRLEAVSQMMAEQFEAEGVSSMDVGGRSVSVRLEPWAKVADKEMFNKWCDDDPDLRRLMSLPWQTVNKLTKDRLLAGEPEPPGVTIWARTKFVLGSE